MKSRTVREGDERTIVLILDQGEEAFAAITGFANRERVIAASITAIGAFSNASVGWFDLAAKKYRPIEVAEQCEVLSLMGDLAEGDDGKASLHLHAVLGLQDGSCRGGHFLSGNRSSNSRSHRDGDGREASSQETPGLGNRADRAVGRLQELSRRP
jgi:hypothetical protein